jgi:hypothetical protein
MNFRTTIILLILLLGVGAYILFTGPAPSSTETKTNPTRLLDIASNDVSKLVITPADGSPIVLERSTLTNTTPTIGPARSDWKITTPVEAYADAMKVSDLIDGIVTATSTSQINIGNSAADYGLDHPQFTVELGAGPKSAKLFIGRQEKAGNELYVQVDGKNVAEVIAADLLDKLDTTADKLRQPRLLDADVNIANWISIARPSDALTLEKSGGQWQMTVATTQPAAHPTTLPAEQSVVGDLVSALNNAQANSFGDASSDAKLLIGTPQATVYISDQKPSTQPSALAETIEFGSPDSLLGKNVWVRVTPPGVLATIPKETMDSVLKGSLDLRDRNVVQVASSEITRIRVLKTIPATTKPFPRPEILHEVVLERRPPPKVDFKAGPPLPATRPTSGPATMASTMPATQPASVWMITSIKTHTDADDSKVDAVLGSFNPLHADKFLAALPPTAGQTTFLVTLTTAKGPPTQVLFYDPGTTATDSPVGVCGDAIFNVPRAVITALDTDFTRIP